MIIQTKLLILAYCGTRQLSLEHAHMEMDITF